MPPILSRAVLMLCLASPPGLPGAFPISRAFANQQVTESFESTETTVLREERPLTEKLPEAIADLDDSLSEVVTGESPVEILSALPEMTETPTLVEEAPVTTEAALPEVIDTPAVELPAAVEPVVVEEAPALVEETPAVVEEIPAVVEEAPVATEAALTEAIDTPAVELPAAVEPVVVEEAPAVVEETPAVVEEIPAVVEEAPVATEAALPEVIDTPAVELPAAVEPVVVEEAPA
ncbi:MAG: hypothetical protein NT069_05790, partial [Planctomycetota bacterium]|nr:hypothetical protein [Planctomycetota bacterium]